MKSNSRVHSIVAIYCVTLWTTNWCVSTSYDRETGLTHSAVDLRGLGVIVGGLATLILARRLWMLVREILDLGIRVPARVRICGDWRMTVYLLPLAFGVDNRWTSLAKDGTRTTTFFEYGGGPSFYSILLSALAIMLFQTVMNLRSLNSQTEQNKPMHRSGGSAATGFRNLPAAAR